MYWKFLGNEKNKKFKCGGSYAEEYFNSNMKKKNHKVEFIDLINSFDSMVDYHFGLRSHALKFI